MVLTYDAYEETLEQQKKKDKRLEQLEDRISMQQKAQEVQQKLLELIATSMKIDVDAGVLRQQLDNTVPADQVEDVDYQHARRGIELIENYHKRL
jgi:hypothetical protein